MRALVTHTGPKCPAIVKLLLILLRNAQYEFGRHCSNITLVAVSCLHCVCLCARLCTSWGVSDMLLVLSVHGEAHTVPVPLLLPPSLPTPQNMQLTLLSSTHTRVQRISVFLDFSYQLYMVFSVRHVI